MKKNKIQEMVGEAVLDSGSLGDPLEADGHSRFFRLGMRGMAVPELLAMVLEEPGKGETRTIVASLLDSCGNLGNLASERFTTLVRMPGMDPARARRLQAAFELGFRARGPRKTFGLVIRRPEDIFPLLREEFRGLDRERFLALYLDTRHRVIAVETVSIGSLNASLVHPREVFKPAVAMSAAAVIVAHNHPSGHACPSDDDLDLTARLGRCGDLLGISLLDHLVVGDDEIISIREFGWPSSRRS